MDFEYLLNLIGDDPVFESSIFFAGNINPKIVRLQLSRWVNNGRIFQLRRGLYALAPPYQKVKPHPFLLANRLQPASYISMQSALAFYGLIPEIVNITVSITTRRPERVETPLGIFEYRHIKPNFFNGYKMVNLGDQMALIAQPEKAIMDLIYLQTGSISLEFLQELRLQNLEMINLDSVKKEAEVFGSTKMRQAAKLISQLGQDKNGDFIDL